MDQSKLDHHRVVFAAVLEQVVEEARFADLTDDGQIDLEQLRLATLRLIAGAIGAGNPCQGASHRASMACKLANDFFSRAEQMRSQTVALRVSEDRSLPRS